MAGKIVLIGYSGHAYVVADGFIRARQPLLGYCEAEEKTHNPFQLPYFGSERSAEGLQILKANQRFVAIGNNAIRRKVSEWLAAHGAAVETRLIHPTAVVATHCTIGAGSMLAAGTILNALATVGQGCICNTGAIIEHECQIDDFAHIAPGAVLAGNVTVGANSFIGANAVVKQGIQIGKNVIIGAGAVVLRDVPDGATVVGNPGKVISEIGD